MQKFQRLFKEAVTKIAEAVTKIAKDEGMNDNDIHIFQAGEQKLM